MQPLFYCAPLRITLASPSQIVLDLFVYLTSKSAEQSAILKLQPPAIEGQIAPMAIHNYVYLWMTHTHTNDAMIFAVFMQ